MILRKVNILLFPFKKEERLIKSSILWSQHYAMVYRQVCSKNSLYYNNQVYNRVNEEINRNQLEHLGEYLAHLEEDLDNLDDHHKPP